MSTKPPLNPPSFRFPHNISGKVEPEVERAIRDTFSGLVVHEQAFNEIKSQIAAAQSAITTAISTSPTNTIETVLSSQFPGLGTINDLTGITIYTTQTADNGAVLKMNDASPVAVSLNSTVAIPYFFFATNLGTGDATLTPTSGLINGAASFTLTPNETAIITFSSPNWVASGVAPGPLSAPAVIHQWLDSYDASTLTFGQSQPTASDVLHAADVTAANIFGPLQTFTNGVKVGGVGLLGELLTAFGSVILEAVIGATGIALLLQLFSGNASMVLQGTTAELISALTTTVSGNIYQSVAMIETTPASFLSASNTVEYQFGSDKNGSPGTIPPPSVAIGDVNTTFNKPVVALSTVTVSAANLLTGGPSATLTLAALTGGGTQGSITFVNGVITAFTPST